MTIEKILTQFNNHLKEFEGGISNLIYQLGDEYNDAKQDTMIRLIKYSENHEIEEDKLKGLMFITLRNTCITVLNRKRNKYSHDDIDEKFDLADEVVDKDLSDYQLTLLDKIKEHLSPLEYNMMVTYFNNIYEDEYDKALTAKIGQLKARMGFSKYYILVEANGNETKFKFLREISTYIGCDYVYFTTAMKSGIFKYKGINYQVKTIGQISDTPKRKKKNNSK